MPAPSTRPNGQGLFAAWNDVTIFQKVRVTETGALEWPGGIDLCGDAVYMRLTGKAPDEALPTLRSASADA